MFGKFFGRSVWYGIGLVLGTVALLHNPANAVFGQSDSTGVSFEQIFDNTFSPDGIRAIQWVEDEPAYTTIEQDDNGHTALVRHGVNGGDRDTLVAPSDLVVEGGGDTLRIQNYQYQSGSGRVLIGTQVDSIWRRSSKAFYYVLDIGNGSLQQIGADTVKIQAAELSPDGSKVGYVQGNNLYVYRLASGQTVQVTDDGRENHIINGLADWVYEEEFSFSKAWFWSPDGSKIAFYRFDESQVREYTIQQWKGGSYPETIEYKYPKAGEVNSKVRIGVYDLEDGQTTWMNAGSQQDQYIPYIDWTQNSNWLAVRRMNRLQNTQDLILFDVETGQGNVAKTETSDAWIEESAALEFIEDEFFIYMSEEDGYNHLYLYQNDGTLIRKLTKGRWDVESFEAYNQERSRIYFTASRPDPKQRHLYSVSLNGSDLQRLTDGQGTHSINMKDNGAYFIDRYSKVANPPIYTLHNSEGAIIRSMENNSELADYIGSKRLPRKEFMQVTVHDSVTLNGYRIVPSDFDTTRKYPVLVYVYGGPDSQTVTDRYSYGQRANWHRYLASRGILVYSFDNRGTKARGADFKKVVYKQLGYYETEDQIAAARQIAQEAYVDSSRIGIWGWSYGGYMTSLAMERGADLYKLGIAVAPVTHWKFYDTIYTERFMQRPQDNPEGYKNSSPLYDADQIEGKFFIIHGTGDDNVHFQNSVEMVDQLIEADKDFKTLFYPNRAHGISGGNTRRHLYRNITDFVMEHL